MARVKGWFMKVIEDAGDNYDGMLNDDFRCFQQQQEQDDVMFLMGDVCSREDE